MDGRERESLRSPSGRLTAQRRAIDLWHMCANGVF
jgi:hypothetical protein